MVEGHKLLSHSLIFITKESFLQYWIIINVAFNKELPEQWFMILNKLFRTFIRKDSRNIFSKIKFLTWSFFINIQDNWSGKE